VMWPMYERCHALLAAGRGLVAEAERWAAETLARAADTGTAWDRLEALRAEGMAALLAHEPERAAVSLGAVWEHTTREGVEEPGVFPVAPDLVEALVELGEDGEASAVATRLRELAVEQEHPWALATAAHCDALSGLVPNTGLADAATAYGELGLAFDRARSLLSLGRSQRRLRRWASARASLEQAVSAFDDLGSPGWAEEARSELERIGGRKPRESNDLTPTERRVAELAADGLTNKELARALFVSVRTVEVHLKHVYAKLGIRSRTQLARHLTRR
jgi:DNA-binding CsgD family transcriptional regulator